MRGPLCGNAEAARVPLLPGRGEDWGPPHRARAAASVHHIASRVPEHSSGLLYPEDLLPLVQPAVWQVH